MEKKKCKDFYDYNEDDDYIGEGGFGIVYKARKKGTNDEEGLRALKIIKKKKIKQSFVDKYRKEPTEEDLKIFYDDIYKEINLMKLMEGNNKENKNTVKFYEYFENKNEFVIVMEYCHENLQDLLSRKKKFNANEIYEILTQLNNSFKIMNQLKLVHRDLTIKNVLIKYKNKEKTKYIVKLSDYGISKRFIDISNFHTQKGTLNFMAPEVISGEYKEECDLWSLGILIYLLYFNEYPFEGNQPMALYNQIQEADLDINTGNSYLDELIKGLLEPSPKDRLKWEKYYNHDFFLKNENFIIEEENFIAIKVKVTEFDKKENENEFKNIYFLDNDILMKNRPCDYKENEEIKALLKDGNIEINLSGNEMDECKKFFKPEKEGEYIIKINFHKKMEDCSYMFSGCENIISIDLSSFDSSNVTNMKYMFGNCYNLEEIKLDNLNTENVINMSYMFKKCPLKKIEFPNTFNTKSVKDMSFMFLFCNDLEEINFPSSFITNIVIYIQGMFGRCYKLKSLDLRNFDTSKVENMLSLFSDCCNLEEISINPSTFITKNVKDMGHMFNNCNKLQNINLSKFETEKVEFYNSMFLSCKALTKLDLSNFKIMNKANMHEMFKDCSNLCDLNLSSFIISEENIINEMLDNLTNIKKIIVNKDYIENFKSIFIGDKSVIKTN